MFDVERAIRCCQVISPPFPFIRCKRCSKSFSLTTTFSSLGAPVAILQEQKNGNEKPQFVCLVMVNYKNLSTFAHMPPLRLEASTSYYQDERVKDGKVQESLHSMSEHKKIVKMGRRH